MPYFPVLWVSDPIQKQLAGLASEEESLLEWMVSSQVSWKQSKREDSRVSWRGHWRESGQHRARS